MQPANIPPPPGYSDTDVVDAPQQPTAAPPSGSAAIPPPPGYSSADVVDAPFTTPGGQQYTPGQSVQHSDGTYGEVTGQHPGTGNVTVKWHQPDAKSFKQGQMVKINGEPSTVMGYTNNGKVIVDGKWGKFGGQRAVSPADIDPNPGSVTSAAAGFANSILGTATGAAHVVGAHPQGLEAAQGSAQDAQAANPASGKAGELAGDLVQFLGANGIVKAGTGMVAALPAAEQYAQASKIVKVLADHPLLARILHAGINGATAGGGLNYLQSGGSGSAAASGAAGGAAAELGGEFLPDVAAGVKAGAQKIGNGVQAVSDLAGKAADYLKTPGTIPEDIYPSKIEVPDAAAKEAALQPHYDAHIQKVADAITNSLKNEGLDLPPVNDIRKLPQNAADMLDKEAGFKYAKVDAEIQKETGFPGRYQETDRNIKDLQSKIRDAHGDPEKQQTLTEQLNKDVAQQKKNMQIINDAGLTEDAKSASRLTKKARAMEDLKNSLLATTRDKGGDLTQINPENFLTHLHNLDNDLTYGKTGRLKQALDQHGDALIQDTKKAATNVRDVKRGFVNTQKQAQNVLTQRSNVRKVGYGLAATGATGALGAAVHGALEH